MVSRKNGGRPKECRFVVKKVHSDYIEHIHSLIKAVEPEINLAELCHANGKCINNKLKNKNSDIEGGFDIKTYEKFVLGKEFPHKNFDKMETRLKGICRLFNVNFETFEQYEIQNPEKNSEHKEIFLKLIDGNSQNNFIILGYLYLLSEEHPLFEDFTARLDSKLRKKIKVECKGNFTKFRELIEITNQNFDKLKPLLDGEGMYEVFDTEKLKKHKTFSDNTDVEFFSSIKRSSLKLSKRTKELIVFTLLGKALGMHFISEKFGLDSLAVGDKIVDAVHKMGLLYYKFALTAVPDTILHEADMVQFWSSVDKIKISSETDSLGFIGKVFEACELPVAEAL